MENIQEQKSRGISQGAIGWGVVVPGGLFRGNCPGEKVRGIIIVEGDFMGAIVQVGSCPEVKCPDTINHNAVFFNYYMSYLPPFPI